MSVELLVIFIVLGVFVGFMAGLLGIGGGGILVPVLTSIFAYLDVPMTHLVHLALGTSMACITITSLSSLMAHHKRGGVIWPLVKVMAPGVILGTFAATFLVALMNAKHLAIFFSIFMAYVSVQMFLDIKPKNTHHTAGNCELFSMATCIGAISALVSIGGGSLTVPYLNWRNVDIKKAIGSSAALGFPIAIAGSLGYLINGLSATINLDYTIGFVFLPAVLLVAIPSYFTAPFGAKMAHYLPVSMLKKIFSLLLMLLSIKMLLLVFNG